jgi:signal transduction histidine kinase
VSNQKWLPAELLQRFSIKALVAVPLQVRGRTIGVMSASRNDRAIGFTSDQVRWLEGVCRHLAVARETADFYEAQRDEARTAAGLATLAGEMISALSTPVVLDRLCRLTTELLDCDCSHTFLLRKKAYVAVSGWGDNPDEAESLRVLEVPPTIIEGFLSRLEHDSAAIVAGSPLSAAAGNGTAELYIALRRGDEIVGIQTAGYRVRPRHFGPWQVRVGRRIGEIASMALENVRLFEQLGRANRLKSDFLATVSHEFRTPLNVILGYCDLLIDSAFGELTAEQTHTLERLRSNARQLLDLISATLDVSRLDGGKLPLQMQAVQVWNMVEEIDADTRDVRERKPQVQLSWNLPTNLPPLTTDRAKLKVVLKNLISNAVKFTDQGKVTVSVHSMGDGLEFAVADTGIGVAPEAQSAIFEPFQQANGSIVTIYGGVGLGLYIVRRLTELLGGHVSMQSEEHKGSTFRVWIPLHHAVERAEAAAYADG